VLNRALVEAGIDRDEVYLTNVVKHFKWKAAPRGKRRIHRKPDLHEVLACTPWLEAEIGQIHPLVLVLSGATAAQAMFGSAFRVTKERGTFLDSPLEMAAFVADLTAAAHKLGSIRTTNT
jgi:DNA polymerase